MYSSNLLIMPPAFSFKLYMYTMSKKWIQHRCLQHFTGHRPPIWKTMFAATLCHLPLCIENLEPMWSDLPEQLAFEWPCMTLHAKVHVDNIYCSDLINPLSDFIKKLSQVWGFFFRVWKCQIQEGKFKVRGRKGTVRHVFLHREWRGMCCQGKWWKQMQ